MKIFYFTATGNNLYVAKNFDAELFSIPKVLKNGPYEFEDDKIGIVYPCYYMGTPRIVEEFLEKVQLKSKYIFTVMSYGGSSFGALSQIQDLIQKSGIELSYVNRVLMVDNYIPMFDIDKQLAKKDDRKIDEKIQEIVSDINDSKVNLPKSSLLSRIVTHYGQKMYRKNLGMYDKNFEVTLDCNGCKICEKVCPVDNIIVDKIPIYKHNCDYCLACTNLCPQNAIRVSSEKSKTRFRNKNVKLSEIIDANI